MTHIVLSSIFLQPPLLKDDLRDNVYHLTKLPIKEDPRKYVLLIGGMYTNPHTQRTAVMKNLMVKRKETFPSVN